MAVVSEEIREQATALVQPFAGMLDGIIAAWVAGQNNRPSAWVFVRQVQAQQEQVHQQRIEVVAQILQRKADAAAAPPAEPVEATEQEYSDWRVRPTSKNAGYIVPNRIGAKFTPAQRASIVRLAQSLGYNARDEGPTKVWVIDNTTYQPISDLDTYGAQGTKRMVRFEREEKRAQAVAARKVETKAATESAVSRPWIVSVFGEDGFNAYNSRALSDFLEGRTATFAGIFGSRSHDGLVSLGAVDAAGNVDFAKVRAAYLAATAPAPAPALPEGILQTQVRMPDGTVEARYTVAMLGNDGAPMASRSLHRTLEEALKEVAINERIQSAAAQRAEEAAQQAETAAARRAAIDPALTGIARAQSAKAQTTLDKQTRFRDRTVTMRQMLDTLLAEGGKMQVRFSVPNLTRTQYNRMDNREQSAWDSKVLEKGLTPEYELWTPDGTGYTISKTEFDYADRGEPLRIKYDYGYLSSDLHDRAKRVTREKYPAIFARETTDTATAPAPVKVAPAERYTYAVAETKVSYPWIIEVFGADAFEPFNLIELSNYLEGRTETFEGEVSDGWWMDGLRSLGAVDAAGRVDFAKVRAAYLAATAPPAEPVEQPRLIEAEKAAKNGVDRRSAAPIHYAAIIEGEANRIFALYA